MFSFVKNEKESSRESCERAKRQLRGGLERAERESWDTERGTKERALRERELKRVQKRAQGRGSHIHSLLSSYVLCPPKGEAAVRLLWFSLLLIRLLYFVCAGLFLNWLQVVNSKKKQSWVGDWRLYRTGPGQQYQRAHASASWSEQGW